MKPYVFVLGIVFLVAACSTQKSAINKHQSITVEKVAEDSVEYDVETFDARFESWYKMNDNPALYRSQQYYEMWNQQYINAWNLNAMNPRKSWFFEPVIGYEPTVNYGFEMNHKLFSYFQYVENVLKIEIMSNGPNSVKH